MTTGEKVFILRIARLDLQLDAKSTELLFCIPPCHKKFLLPGLEIERSVNTGGNDKLHLILQRQPLDEEKGGRTLFENINRGIKEEENGNLIFSLPRVSPPTQITIEPGFKEGRIVGEFPLEDPGDFYPLQSLELMLFSNWLAMYGDFILHASGFIKDDQGFVFAGPSGVGKSTLVKTLFSDPTITVLGEDQVILRYLDDQIWVFGTPWHEHTEMCSPRGTILKKLFFLDRHVEPGVKSLSPVEGVTHLLQTAFIPFYRQDLLPGLLDRLALMAEKVPFYTLSYRLGTDPLAQILNA